MKLTSGRRKLLDALSSGVKLELQFAGQYNDVQALRKEGIIERVPHPTVKDRANYPADGLQLTEKGRSMLAESEQTRAPRLPRSKVVSSQGYDVRERLARLSCGHEIVIRARGATMQYPKTVVCTVCNLAEFRKALAASGDKEMK